MAEQPGDRIAAAERPVPLEETGHHPASAVEAIVKLVDGFQGVLSMFQADAEGLAAALKDHPSLPISPAILGTVEEIKAIIESLDALVEATGVTVRASQPPADLNSDRPGQQ
jgi:hypothetical protein